MKIEIIIDDRIVRAVRTALGPKPLAFAACSGLLLAGSYAYAIPSEPIHAFAPNTPISSGDVNENFSSLFSAVAAVEETVATLGPPVTGSNNVEVVDGVVGLADNVAIDGTLVVGGGLMQLEGVPSPSTWNNAGNGSTALVNSVNHSSCSAETRGSIRVWMLDESTPDGDNHDALCYCREYLDDTTGVANYRWSCFHGVNDGT